MQFLIPAIIAFSTWPKQCNAQSATLHRPPKKIQKIYKEKEVKPQQINKRTQRVMRAKISLFKEPETGFLGRQQKSLTSGVGVPGARQHICHSQGAPGGDMARGNNHEQIL